MISGFTICLANTRERLRHPATEQYKQGRAPYIAFLDDDDIWISEKLEQQNAFLNNHPHCVLLGSNALIMKENQDYRKDTLSLYFKKAPFGLIPYKKLVQDDYFINSSAVIRRSALRYAGLQNETLHKGPDGEDHDLWLRIGSAGRNVVDALPLVVYRELSSKHAALQRQPWRGEKNRIGQGIKIYQSALTGVGEMPSPLLFPEYTGRNGMPQRNGFLCRRPPVSGTV